MSTDMARKSAQNHYLMDFSLGLVNRTGAFIICRDLLDELPEFFPQIRYWRMFLKRTPDGLPRKIAARLMMTELKVMRGHERFLWPDGCSLKGRHRLILDPLYVLRSKLERTDIVQCHDVGPVTHPKLFGTSIAGLYKEAYDKIQRVGPGVVFVSDATQSAFKNLYGDNFRFMQTVAQYVRPGVLSGQVEPVPGISSPFLLTVGALEHRKNYVRVIEAYSKSGLYQRGVAYVFCGARGLGSNEILEKAASTPGVTALGYVTEAQLRWLYLNGSGFVLPSLLEGFGLPALEAAQRGLVPLVSAGGAQEEAIGGAGILADPESVDSIRAGLLQLVDMDDEQKRVYVDRATKRSETLTYARYIAGWNKVLSRNNRFQNTNGWAADDPEELSQHGTTRLIASLPAR
jgi:glycosyltransferase involved in cell wall biosynthesis